MRPRPDGRGQGQVDRRTLLRGGVVGGVGAVALATGVASAPAPSARDDVLPAGDLTEAFHGRWQAGILTAPQPHAAFVALDLDPGADRERLSRLMRIWTDDISRLMSGRAPVTDQEPELAARVSGLTVTVGWGAPLFDRVGLEERRPPWLQPVPPLGIDRLDPAWGQSDLVLQVAAHSPLTVARTRRLLVGAARGLASVTWVQTGHREPMERHGWSMRNQFGQVDGTVQPSLTQDGGRDLGLVVIGGDRLAGDADPSPVTGDVDPWWVGGSSLVLRRIAMDLEGWERADRVAREHLLGRDLAGGAPLSGGTVDTPVDLHATLPGGLPVIDAAAHVRRASPHAPGERFLRRPYMYEDAGPHGRTEAGLLFTAYQADPVRQFVPVQQRLAEADLLNLYTTPVGSAVYALLPGCPRGGWLGQPLLA